jgi:hypothetical protein
MLRRVALVRTLQEPHDATSQKTAFFIATDVDTPDLTKINRLLVFVFR